MFLTEKQQQLTDPNTNPVCSLRIKVQRYTYIMSAIERNILLPSVYLGFNFSSPHRLSSLRFRKRALSTNICMIALPTQKQKTHAHTHTSKHTPTFTLTLTLTETALSHA